MGLDVSRTAVTGSGLGVKMRRACVGSGDGTCFACCRAHEGVKGERYSSSRFVVSGVKMRRYGYGIWRLGLPACLGGTHVRYLA